MQTSSHFTLIQIGKPDQAEKFLYSPPGSQTYRNRSLNAGENASYYKQLLRVFDQQPDEIRSYLAKVPQLLDNSYPYEVTIGYIFFMIEWAQRRLLYGIVIKQHALNTEVADSMITAYDMKRNDFLAKCKSLPGTDIPQKALKLFTAAAKMRDHSMHGRVPSDANLRQGINDAILYCTELHLYAIKLASFSPFGDMRGLSGSKSKIPKDTSALVLRGPGF